MGATTVYIVGGHCPFGLSRRALLQLFYSACADGGLSTAAMSLGGPSRKPPWPPAGSAVWGRRAAGVGANPPLMTGAGRRAVRIRDQVLPNSKPPAFNRAWAAGKLRNSIKARAVLA
jgi:hypothetical protein